MQLIPEEAGSKTPTFEPAESSNATGILLIDASSSIPYMGIS
jgi:hypothetical protein